MAMVLGAMVFLFSSCKDQRIGGCTDRFAINYNVSADYSDGSCRYLGCTDPDSYTYDSDATDDDNSCLYTGDIVFWYGEDVAEWLSGWEVSSITIYVDGKIAGSQNATLYFQSAPNCGGNATMSYTVDLGSQKSKTISYYTVDSDGDTSWSGDIVINANSCKTFELRLSNSRSSKK